MLEPAGLGWSVIYALAPLTPPEELTGNVGNLSKHLAECEQELGSGPLAARLATHLSQVGGPKAEVV